jgi:hypothetical protein
MGAVDETLGQVELPPGAKVLSQVLQDPVEHAFALPLLKAAMDRLVRRIPTRQIRPRSAGAHHP